MSWTSLYIAGNTQNPHLPASASQILELKLDITTSSLEEKYLHLKMMEQRKSFYFLYIFHNKVTQHLATEFEYNVW